jgi:hypothetical protein
MGRIAKASAHTGPRSHLFSLNGEAARLFMTPGDFGHGPLGGLDMACGALRIVSSKLRGFALLFLI